MDNENILIENLELKPNNVDDDNLNKIGAQYQSDIFELPVGQALSLDDTYSITSSEYTRFIVVAGPSGCGKTTLVTSLYHLFQKGPIGNFYFAASQTLQGFEQRAFKARTSSHLSIPETIKTRRGISDSILHLKLWDTKKNYRYNFLMSDFSGEDYSSAIANVELMIEDFSVIKRADTIVIIIDGDRISNKKSRHGTFQQTTELLKTINDANLFSESVIVEFVISKYDLVKKRSETDPAIMEYIDKLKDKILGKTDNLPDIAIKFFRIAAMPSDSGDCETGFGIADLLQSWTESRTIEYVTEPILTPVKSEFNKFQNRTIGGT
jgi:GTPase SAR1 family protein